MQLFTGYVYTINIDNKNTIKLNSDGTYVFLAPVKNGTVLLTAAAKFYEPYFKEFTVSSGNIILEDITLKMCQKIEKQNLVYL